MACGCIDTIAEKLDDKFGGKIEYTNLLETLSFATGKISTSLEPLRFTYPIKKKDGTLAQKRKKSYVMFTYCPFCGKKYADSAA